MSYVKRQEACCLLKTNKLLTPVQVVPADGEAPVWHEDVSFFKVLKNGQPKAFFFLDPYSRPAEKRGGAWMAEVVGQVRVILSFIRGVCFLVFIRTRCDVCVCGSNPFACVLMCACLTLTQLMPRICTARAFKECKT